jgi:3-phytase
MSRLVVVCLCGVVVLAACAAQGPFSQRSRRIVDVPPSAETGPVPSRADAADDAAIWINPDDAAASLIVATDKQSGLLVYGLDGSQRQYLPLGYTNNVDLRTGSWGESGSSLVAASSRFPSELLLLTLNHHSGRLQLRERHKVNLRQPYGICLYQDANRQPYVFLNSKEGTLVQYSVDPDYGIAELRRAKIKTQPEGCVADDETGVLYIGEEGRGIWRMSANPEDPAQFELFDGIASGHLVPDVEGLALYDGPRKLLIASSQGNSSFALYDVATSDFLASFRIAGAKLVDDVSDSDGVAASSVGLPGYPDGILVVQDDRNTRPKANQNFKIVSWSDVLRTIDAR